MDVGMMAKRILSVGIEHSKFAKLTIDLEKFNAHILEMPCIHKIPEIAEQFNLHYDCILIGNHVAEQDIELFLKRQEIGNIDILILYNNQSLSASINFARWTNVQFITGSLSAQNITKTLHLVRKNKIDAEPNKNDAHHFGGVFVGNSSKMLDLYEKIDRLAKSKSTVFITGESGTGKEVCAEAIHQHGPRRTRPFVAVNCGSIPENLIESELFGHAKGAFTGAVSERKGAVVEANGGTLFLDEIGEMPLPMQVKLLRFLQSGSVQRIGDSRPVDVDVRIVAATNRIPEEEVAAGRFREDLYYRLNVIRLEMPPLRERGDDYAFLANYYLAKFAEEEGRTFNPLSKDVLTTLGRREWPGNVRELQNAIRRAVVLNDGPYLDENQFPAQHANRPEPRSVRTHYSPVESIAPPSRIAASEPLTYDEIERRAIEDAIVRCGGSLPNAARQLGISASTMYRKRERWCQTG